MILLIGNDQVITLYGLRDALTGQYIAGADATMTVKKLGGVPVEGQTWPSDLVYQVDPLDPLGVDLPIPIPPAGNYRGILESALKLVNGKYYTLEVNVDAGSGLIAMFRYKVQALFREATI